MEDIQKAWIRQNNVRWIMQKVSEGCDHPKVESEHPIQFVSTPYYDVSKTTPSSQVFIDIPRRSEYNVQELLEFLRTLGKGHTSTPSECQSCKYYFGSSFLQCAVNPTRKADQDCADFESTSNVLGSDWKNGEAIEPMIYSELNQGLPIMMFDMHPTASPHCTPHIIGPILFAIVREHDSSEDNPANYLDWENSENNPANYSEY